jgi:teichuronic acid exporter
MRLLGQLFTWTITFIIIRILEPADYGLMELAGVFLSFLGMISEFGLGAAIVQSREIDEDKLKKILGFVMTVSVVFCFFLVAAAEPIAMFYNEPKLTMMIWALSFTFIISGLTVIPAHLLWRNQEFRKIALIDFISAISGSVTALFLALYGMGVWALVFGMLSLRIVNLICYHVVNPFLKVPSLSFKGMKSILVYSWNVTLARIFWYIYTSASASLIIGKVLGPERLGVYSIALYLACLPMEKVSGIINQVAFPAFSSIQENKQLVGKHFIKAVRILSIITIPVFWGISSITPEIVKVFLGVKWSDAILPMQIIALVIPLRMARNIMLPTLLGIGQSTINLVNELVAMVIMSLAFYYAAWFGLVAVSLVWLILFPVVFIVNLLSASKVMGINVLQVLGAMIKPALAGIIMMASVEITRRMFILNFSIIVQMILFITVGALMYLLGMLLLDKNGLQEVLNLRNTK